MCDYNDCALDWDKTSWEMSSKDSKQQVSFVGIKDDFSIETQHFKAKGDNTMFIFFGILASRFQLTANS